MAAVGRGTEVLCVGRLGMSWPPGLLRLGKCKLPNMIGNSIPSTLTFPWFPHALVRVAA